MLANPSKPVKDMIREVARQIRKTEATFTFTSVQLVLNGRAIMHIDANNVGPSMAVAIGPFFGGQLTVYEGSEQGHTPYANKGEWQHFNGLMPRHVFPYEGERLAFVAFTHSSAYTSSASRLWQHAGVPESQASRRDTSP